MSVQPSRIGRTRIQALMASPQLHAIERERVGGLLDRGHHSFAMTQKHYAQPAAIVNAGTARVTSVLDGGGPASPSAADLLRQLDSETLAELAQLLVTRKSEEDAAN